ncbi:histidine phosphatase family protein [Pseudofrankia inefficax]|uniref:Phosphoglycerate mutase n=1 Tax=Pseudofrankia inefficax (strain DSM 45817 / CECT 9037 / DDB 130130 / EuI1c) TaxID=298654 RepID=E3JCA8_PSEI1|nr:histidine phosphatase family protein [Pseudofrankia inefficax]ADP84697.1 Phosphoglycerate mutase [Pseudofrankia inefficax]
MSVIYLVRHGQASFGAADYDVLSELGHRQAALAGAELRARGVRIDLAASGTLRRQRETAAAALAAYAGAPASQPATGTGAGPAVALGDGGWAGETEADARWNEYDQDTMVGDGRPPAQRVSTSSGISSRSFQGLLDNALAEWMGRGDTGPGSFRAFSDGVAGALDELSGRLGSGGTAVVFSSAGPIAALCGRLLGVGVEGLVQLNRTMINGGITKIVSGRSGTSLISVNEHSHIDAAGRELLSYR